MPIPAILASVGGALGSAALKGVGDAAMGTAQSYVGNMAGKVGSVGLNDQKQIFEYAQKAGIDPRVLMDYESQKIRQEKQIDNADAMRGTAFRNRLTQDLDRATTMNDLARASFQNANENARTLANNYANAAMQSQQNAAMLFGGSFR